MPRAIWKGAISFGLVTVPVGLYAATERASELHFRLLHAKDESPIDYKRVCEAEGVEVPWKDIVKGYEVSKGEFVVMTDKDFARARTDATQTFAVRDFVPARAIDFLYFEQPYYLAPQGKAAAKSYALLRDALAKADRVGVGTFVLRQREHLGALEPVGNALVLTTLRFAHEIRKPDTLDLPGRTRFGPNVEWLPAGTRAADLDYAVDPRLAATFYAAIKTYWPRIRADSLEPAYAGVRPKISGPGEPAADFQIRALATPGSPSVVQLFGIESPGLTASLALAAEVAALLG